jgi:hypothetical protein
MPAMFCGRTGTDAGAEDDDEEAEAVVGGEVPFTVPLGSIFTSFIVVSAMIPFAEG